MSSSMVSSPSSGPSVLVKTLPELTLGDLPEGGGKACRLAEMLRAGLPVPRGIVILSRAYEILAQGCDLGVRGDAAGLRALRAEIESRPLPEGLEEEIIAGLVRIDLAVAATPLVVRSSSPNEDGSYRSGAGVYESQLNVRGREALLSAVKACWASLWTERAVAHARSGRPAMAVLIQELVPASASGILFTLNPLTASENEMLVEATCGLAAELASGEVTPDRFVVDFWSGALRRGETGRKVSALLPAAGGGLERRNLAPEEADAPCLVPGQLAELAELGRRIQRLFGRPQDVEFGLSGSQFHVLQARPITVYTFPPDQEQWTTANFREVMPGFASLLGQSQSFHHDFARAQEELFRRLKLWRPADEGTVWAKTIFGHGYWNAGATKRMAARIPGYNERSMDRTVGIDPAYEGDGQVTPWNLRTIVGAIPTLLALGRQYEKTPVEARDFTEGFEKEEPIWDAVRPKDLDSRSLADWVRRGLDLHWRANRWALLTSFLSTQAQEDFHRTLTTLGRKAPAGACPSEARLMTGLTGMATARPLWDLWRLSQVFSEHRDAVRRLRETPSAELAALLPELAARGPGAEAWRAVLDWIERYRHMSNIDEDLSVPRWWEDPSVPLSILRGYLLEGTAEGAARAGDSARIGDPSRTGAASDPGRQIERQRLVREEEEAKARALGRRWLSHGLDPLWWGRFRKQYRLVKTMCWWREETRVYLSRARYHCRRLLVEQSRRWAETGWLGRTDDIFWLTRDEVLDLTTPDADFTVPREMISRRRSVAALYRNFHVPPNIAPGSYGADGLPLRGAGPARNGYAQDIEAAARNGKAVYQGVGCSAGQVAGPCRVALDIEEAAGLRVGEILVAPHANPAWTPLFHLAAGLVLEEGGLLSHSAVVAREYGVPAVLQVKGATRLFRTGDILIIDGAAGTVAAEPKR